MTNSIPISGGGELNQTEYGQFEALDSVLYKGSTSVEGKMIQVLHVYDLLSVLKNNLSEDFFIDRGATTLEKQVDVIKNITKKSVVSTFGFSSNVLNLKTWAWNQWNGDISSDANQTKELNHYISSSYIQNDGKVYVLVYSNPAVSSKSSNVNIDYSKLTVDIEISMNEHIKSMIAAYSGENIDKKFVGLGNVDNYGTATQNEAESGSVSDKFMTPFRTKQYISYRMATQTEAENGISTEKFMTPLRTKQHVDNRFATIEEAISGVINNKFISPVTLKEALISDNPVIRLNDLNSKLIKVNDWVPLTLNAGFKGADGTTPKYRITEYPKPDGSGVRKNIEFDGAWTNDSGSIPSSGSTQLQWCNLPQELRPAQTKMFPSQCSAFSTTGRIAFTNNGICYGAQSSGTAVTYMYITGMSYWIGE